MGGHHHWAREGSSGTSGHAFFLSVLCSRGHELVLHFLGFVASFLRRDTIAALGCWGEDGVFQLESRVVHSLQTLKRWELGLPKPCLCCGPSKVAQTASARSAQRIKSKTTFPPHVSLAV